LVNRGTQILNNKEALQGVKSVGHTKLNISCQDVSPPKGFDMKNRTKPRIGLVDYHLECCIEARFRKITSTRKLSSVWLNCG